MSKKLLLPMFPFKKKGPLRPEEHKECVDQFGPCYKRMLRVLEPLGHVVKGRVQSDRSGKPALCGYVYYSQRTFDADQRGAMYIVQNLKNRDNFEIVFRRWDGHLPICRTIWDEELDDDRYEVCKATIQRGKWQWKAFTVKTTEDEQRATELVRLAKGTYEQVFAEAFARFEESQGKEGTDKSPSRIRRQALVCTRKRE